jgi:hypothetical protein
MKLIRLKKEKNDFAIANLTLGRVMAIRNALQSCKNAEMLGPVGEDVLNDMVSWDIDNIIDFGDSHISKVTAQL